MNKTINFERGYIVRLLKSSHQKLTGTNVSTTVCDRHPVCDDLCHK